MKITRRNAVENVAVLTCEGLITLEHGDMNNFDRTMSGCKKKNQRGTFLYSTSRRCLIHAL